MVLKLPIMFPLCALPSPMLTVCEVWAMISYGILRYPTVSYGILRYPTVSYGILRYPTVLVECRNSAAICTGARGVYKHSVTRAEESWAMWLSVAQLLSNHFLFV